MIPQPLARRRPGSVLIRVALEQMALAALLSLLLAGWLHIPDANGFEVLASASLAVVLVIVAGAAETAVALHLTQRAMTLRRLLLGVGVLFAAALLWYLVSLGLGRLGQADTLRAGYWNSRLPASLRHTFSYDPLLVGLSWAWGLLRVLVAALLAALAFALITSPTPARGLGVVLRSGRVWLAVALLALHDLFVMPRLLSWTPGHGLAVELLSLILRLCTVLVLAAGALAFWLTSVASRLTATYRVGPAPGTAPEPPHPRTADIP